MPLNQLVAHDMNSDRSDPADFCDEELPPPISKQAHLNPEADEESALPPPLNVRHPSPSRNTPDRTAETARSPPRPKRDGSMRQPHAQSPLPQTTGIASHDRGDDSTSTGLSTVSSHASLPAQARDSLSLADSSSNNQYRGQAEHQRQDDQEAESIALARMLMQQEAIESYGALSADYLRYNSNQFSREDMEALQAALAEDEGSGEAVYQSDLSYETMLRLGESIGDVKKERWNIIAQSQIEKIPTFQFDPKTAKGKDQNDSNVKCLVCQFRYEADESLRRLPCGHCFHGECVAQWLKDNDICPYCRQTIVVQW